MAEAAHAQELQEAEEAEASAAKELREAEDAGTKLRQTRTHTHVDTPIGFCPSRI